MTGPDDRGATLPDRTTSEDGSPADAKTVALHDLFDRLHLEPWSYDFFALLRRLDALRPEQPRFGRALRPSQEVIRLGQEAELEFAPAALATFGYEGGAAPRLGVRFFGLLGPQGPMPLFLTEYVRERQRFRNDPTAARFLDVFHHRLLALFYRAWADSQPTVQHDRPHDDRFAAWLGSGAGLGGAAGSPHRLAQAAQLFQTGLLGARSRHPEGLTKILTQYFGVPVRIESHVAHWLAITAEDRSRLGFASNRVGRRMRDAAMLGRSATAGHKVHDRQYKFRVALGPLPLVRYLDFLPGGSAWLALCDWVRQYAGLDLRWDVELCLAAPDVPEARIGRRFSSPTVGESRDLAVAIPAERRIRLGVTAWLGFAGGRPGGAADRPGGVQQRHRADLRVRPDTSFLLRRQVCSAHLDRSNGEPS